MGPLHHNWGNDCYLLHVAKKMGIVKHGCLHACFWKWKSHQSGNATETNITLINSHQQLNINLVFHTTLENLKQFLLLLNINNILTFRQTEWFGTLKQSAWERNELQDKIDKFFWFVSSQSPKGRLTEFCVTFSSSHIHGLLDYQCLLLSSTWNH